MKNLKKIVAELLVGNHEPIKICLFSAIIGFSCFYLGVHFFLSFIFGRPLNIATQDQLNFNNYVFH